MTPHRGIPVWLIPISCLVATIALADPAPEKALKYHEALLKRPHNAALFDRFFGAWIDEQPVETLDAFLKARAQSDGGQNWTVLATYELRRGHEEEALAGLGKGIDALADDPALPMERAKLRLRRLEFDGARADLAKVAAGKDEVLALEAAKLTGKSWLREGRTEDAIKAWDAVLAAHPNDEDLLEDLIETAAAESETAQALVYADKLIAVSRDPYQKTLRMLRRGDVLAQAGRNDEAVEAYAGTLNQVGEGSWLEREVLAQIEKVFRKQDRLDDLTAQLKKLAGIYPQRLLIHRQLAKLEAAQGETDAAIGRFREVLKRSPGERELREEFVRLLVDGERFDDAVAELEKLIVLAPADSELYLQVAALRSHQGKPEAVLAALRKARELLGKDEGNGIRIAGLMLQYGLIEPGESLLTELAAGGGPAAMEALAAQYGRTGRKAEAVELLKKAGAGDDVDVLLRTSGAISTLGESATALATLTARVEKFSTDPRFLAALAQSALAAGKPAEVVPQALKLVRLAKQANDLAESIGLASRVIMAAEKSDEVRAALASQANRSTAETCLLATLIENSGDFSEVGKLLELDPDPLVIHFHAALLDRRGEFEQAIAIISRLADTGEGRKAGYFKDLSELQQRAGKIPEALATVERWKLAAPGDKTAWITGSRLLRESGKPELAVKMARQAVGRFEGDADLAASLAALHDEAGQWLEAEAIYWKLYDDGQSPTEQARWAAQLAQLAQRTGKTGEMEDKLRERARGNRRSIGPILALAELARVTEDENKRRDLLLDAVRLQPKDLDLRLQIASLEEKAGNPERMLAILEESLAFDVGNRVRSALAQAYIRQGQPLKGLRELRQLSGKSGFDPRTAESAAASLAGTKLYDEAIGFLRAELPDGGDWRSRYLLGMLLEEDGREGEALPVFLDLLQAQGEIPSLIPPVAPGHDDLADYPVQVRTIMQWMVANQSAYAHRNRGSGGYFMGSTLSLVGSFSLPNTPEEVRQLALIHLCELSKRKPGGMDESIRKKVKAAGINNVDFIADLTANHQADEPDVAKLLKTHPDEPGVFELMMIYGVAFDSETIDDKLIGEILEHDEKLSPICRFNAWSILAKRAKPEDPAWTSLIAAARSCIGQEQSEMYSSISNDLTNLLQGDHGDCPAIHRPAVKQLLLDDLAARIKAHPEVAHDTDALSVLSVAGTPDAWLQELNATIREFRKKSAQAPPGSGIRTRSAQILQYASRGSNNPFSTMDGLFAAPTLETLSMSSLPNEVLAWFTDDRGSREVRQPFLTLEELLKHSDEIESPVLRAWLATKLGDAAAIAKAMAVVPPPEEAGDFDLLRVVIALRDKKPLDAFAALLKARSAVGADREMVDSVNLSLIAVAGSMTPVERAPLTEELQATIQQCRPILGKPGTRVLAAQARKLGLDELAKRLEPLASTGGKSATGPAVIAAVPAAGPSSSTVTPGSPDKIRKFIIEKKSEAAAREVLLGIRSQDAGQLRDYLTSELPDLISLLGRDGQAELLKLADPGDSKSLVKRLEFVAICDALGKPELAVAMLEALLKERPDDQGIAARLAFTVPADAIERRLDLMTRACKADAFVTEVSAAADRLDSLSDNKQSLEFFETVTRWLETVDPKAVEGANLTWVSYLVSRFFAGSFTSDLPSLLEKRDESDADKILMERQRGICWRLAHAMLRHTSCAEEGFRLIARAKAWKPEATEMDGWARHALLAAASPESSDFARRLGQSPFFQVVETNGGGRSSDDLSECSSASWLLTRLNAAKNPAEIFPADYLASLRERNPDVGEIISALCRKLTSADLPGLWKSDVMTPGRNRLRDMLRPLILLRLAATPGATKFFVDQIAVITPGKAANQDYRGNSEDVPLCTAAILSAANGKPGDVETVARAITRAVFGGKVDFSAPRNRSNDSSRLGFMEKLSDQIVDNPLAMVRFQGAFCRLGVPLGTSESNASQPFGSKKFDSVDAAEKFLESLGWLTDVGQWDPYVSLIYQRDSNDSSGAATLEPKLALGRALENIRHYTYSQEDLVKRLKERKTGRFGSLMVAAGLSSGTRRSALAGQAFTEFAGEVAKLSPERVETFALLLPWLTDEAQARVPDKFQRKVREAGTVKRGEVLAMADKFVASMTTRGGEISINRVQPVVASLIPYDLDKAVEIFSAADDEFTDSLGRGGRFSNSTSGEYEISERDRAFSRLTQSYSEETGPFSSDPSLRLRFLAKILASPSGKRLAFSEPGDSNRGVFSTSVLPLLKEENNGVRDGGSIIRLVKVFKALEPGLKSVALPCFVLTDLQTGGFSNVKERQALLQQTAAVVANDPQAGRLMTARLALWSWRVCTPEEKAEARTVLAGLIADESVPDVVRLAMAVQFLTKLPKDELLDPAFCTALANLYQTYCGGGRSAVSPLSEWLFKVLAKSPGRDESAVALDAALARAFWENASAAKPAGHPPIPNSLAQPVFITALLGKDTELVAKIFPRIKAALAGKLVPMISLMQLGRPDLARQLAPLPGDPLLSESHELCYDRALEGSLVTFKQAGADKPTVQKLELALLDFPVGSDAEAPAEPLEARADRLIGDVAASPPDGMLFQSALLSLLARSPENTRLLALLDTWAKANAFDGFLVGGVGSDPFAESPAPSSNAVVLHGIAAMHALARGDSSLLKAIIGAIGDPIRNRSRNNSDVQQCLIGMVREMSLAVWFDVCAGTTKGYQAGLPVWNDFMVNFAEGIASYDPSEVNDALTVSHFLACWAGEPAAFDAMCGRLPGKLAEPLKQFVPDEGLLRFMESVRGRAGSRSMPEAVSYPAFMRKTLSHPGFASYIQTHPRWLDALMQVGGYAFELSVIAANPPAGLIPEALPALYWHCGKWLQERKPAEALAALRKGIELCPAGSAWNFPRGDLKLELANQLRTGNQLDEARKVFATIPVDEVSEAMKEPHAALAKALNPNPKP